LIFIDVVKREPGTPSFPTSKK